MNVTPMPCRFLEAHVCAEKTGANHRGETCSPTIVDLHFLAQNGRWVEVLNDTD